MKNKWTDFAFLMTISVFLVAFININLVLVALFCFTFPFVIAAITKKQKWCRSICPRKSMFLKVISKISLKRKAPKFLTSKFLRTFFVVYFAIFLSVVMLSTYMVYQGTIEPILHVKFFLFFDAFNLPQVFTLEGYETLSHFSYRIYSGLFTTTMIGLTLGILFKPTSWCVICPINTLTRDMVKGFKKKEEKRLLKQSKKEQLEMN